MKILFVFLLVSVVLIAGCAQTAAPSGKSVNIQSFAFSPADLTVNLGDTVVWTNKDSVAHTVTSDSGTELDSPQIPNGQTYSHKFATAGTFTYHCSLHPSMKGTITVK